MGSMVEGQGSATIAPPGPRPKHIAQDDEPKAPQAAHSFTLCQPSHIGHPSHQPSPQRRLGSPATKRHTARDPSLRWDDEPRLPL